MNKLKTAITNLSEGMRRVRERYTEPSDEQILHDYHSGKILPVDETELRRWAVEQAVKANAGLGRGVIALSEKIVKYVKGEDYE